MRVLSTESPLSVDAIMAELHIRVRERIRADLLRRGGTRDFEDPRLFSEVEDLLSRAVEPGEPRELLLPHLLGDPAAWRLRTALTYQSHRTPLGARLIIGLKRRLLMPAFRWLFEYSRDNFERQQRLNVVLMTCVEELALELARLRLDTTPASVPDTTSADRP